MSPEDFRLLHDLTLRGHLSPFGTNRLILLGQPAHSAKPSPDYCPSPTLLGAGQVGLSGLLPSGDPGAGCDIQQEKSGRGGIVEGCAENANQLPLLMLGLLAQVCQKP